MDLAPVPRDPEEPFVPDLSEGAEAGLYLSLFELMNEGLIITSDETILEVNAAVCRLMERSYRDLAGQPLSTLFPSERAFLNARSALFIQGEVRGSLRVKLPGGRERSLAYVAAARIRPGVHAIILGPDPVTGVGPEAARAADTVWPRLAAALDQPALVIDARNRIMAANAPARQRFNAIDAHLTGKPLGVVCTLPESARDTGPVSVAPTDGSPAMHGRLLIGPEPGWRILLLTGQAPLAPVDARAGRVFRHAPLPMLVVREDDLRIVAVNEAAATAYGQSRAQLLQLPLDALREGTEGKHALAPGMWHWRGARGPFPAHTQVQPLDGAHREWLIMHEAPAAGPADMPDGLAPFVADAHALPATGAVQVHFQAVVDTLTGGLVAAEVPGVDGAIGFDALRLACEHAAEWHQAGMAIPLAIEATANMLDHESLVDTVSNLLSASHLPASALTLNIPEVCLLAPGDALRKHLTAIDALGVRLAVSGAGANPLPMQTLLELPIRTLKLDHTLVRDCQHPQRAKLLRAALAAAEALGIDTQAVGVDTPEQAEAIAALGCTRQQGELYAPPRQADDFAQML